MIETAGDFDQMARQLQGAMDQLLKASLTPLGRGDTWSPAINVYQVGQRIEACAELAGVDRQSIEVTVEPGRLIIRGHRHAPQPTQVGAETIRVLAMEIDHGPFERVFALASEVDVAGVTAEQAAGLLWVRLPIHL